MTRTPTFLAALASAAVPGLDPVTAQAGSASAGHLFETAFIEDDDHRRWTIRAPLTEVAAAELETAVSILTLLARRVPFSVPVPKGFVRVAQGRAMVYASLQGQPLDLRELPSGPGLAADIGRTIAHLHNIDRALFDEAGVPSYEADAYRQRRLTELDRAAATGHVPTGLLSRWERILEDVSLWRFAPVPVHGDLRGERLLALFDDDDDASTGRIKGIVGWEKAKIADPADDFAYLIALASEAAFDSVVEAYAQTCLNRPDTALRQRAVLASEMRLITQLLSALATGDQLGIARRAEQLRQLDEQTWEQDETTPTAPGNNDAFGMDEYWESAIRHGRVATHAGAATAPETSAAPRATTPSDVDEPTQAAIPMWTDDEPRKPVEFEDDEPAISAVPTEEITLPEGHPATVTPDDDPAAADDMPQAEPDADDPQEIVDDEHEGRSGFVAVKKPDDEAAPSATTDSNPKGSRSPRGPRRLGDSSQ